MKCIHRTVIGLLIPILVLHGSSAGLTKTPVRNGKFMAFTVHDMFSDLLDDVEDPLPEAIEKNDREKASRMNETATKISDTKMTKLPMKTDEKIALYNQNTGKFELITTTSGHFSFPVKPVTEKGTFFYGGQHYQYQKPPEHPNGGNRTEEIKIFWSAVGDAVENSPYFPIQINVPDMITAMANFLVNYIPFINRITNPNRPRLPYQVPGKNYSERPMDYYDNYDFYQTNQNALSRRDFEDEENSTKVRRKNKRKSNKKKNSSSRKSSPKGIFPRPNFRQTTSPPVEDMKLWHQFGTDSKETFRLKNMPITRKRVRVADREIFNFKNSDISNSPIMIVNVPQRPITHYKITHNEVKEKEGAMQQPPQPQRQQKLQQQPSRQLTPELKEKSSKVNKQRRKLKNETKPKRSSKRTGRSEIPVTENTTSGQIAS